MLPESESTLVTEDEISELEGTSLYTTTQL